MAKKVVLLGGVVKGGIFFYLCVPLETIGGLLYTKEYKCLYSCLTN